MCPHCVLIREHHDCKHATQQQLNKIAQEVQQAGYFPASWGDIKCLFPRQQSIVILHSKLKSPLNFSSLLLRCPLSVYPFYLDLHLCLLLSILAPFLFFHPSPCFTLSPLLSSFTHLYYPSS